MNPYIAIIWSHGNEKACVRSIPADDCEEYWCIPNWTQVRATDIDEVWARIFIGNFVGYIKRKYLLYGGDAHETGSDIM